MMPRGYEQTASGLYLPSALVAPERPTCLDLFAGCGGFSLGMIQGGFRVVAACDADELAALTYLTNLGDYPLGMHFLDEGGREKFERLISRPERGRRGSSEALQVPPVSGSNRPAHIPGVPHFFLGDIRKLTGEQVLRALGMEVGDLDIVVGGPPCQGFSTAGRREVMDPRNSLVFEFTRLVCELQPKAICMENVPGIMSMVTPEGIPVMDAICLSLNKGGYGTLDALRKSLGADAGRRAAVRNPQRKAPDESPPDVAQTNQLTFTL